MHDPMVVAWEVPFPLPRRKRWAEKHYRGRRWGWTRRRRTNDENLGEPVFPWWRPDGWTFALGGRCYQLRRFATIWHVEPGGRDSGEVCKHWNRWKDEDGKWHGEPRSAWRWHVHHWKIQLPWAQDIRARLFDRCAECGRKGRPNHSFQWDGKRLGWWKFRSREGLYHRECADLRSLRLSRTTDERLIRTLFAAYRVAIDESEADALALLTDARKRAMEFGDAYRLTRLLGYERDDSYRLVPAPARGAS